MQVCRANKWITCGEIAEIIPMPKRCRPKWLILLKLKIRNSKQLASISKISIRWSWKRYQSRMKAKIERLMSKYQARSHRPWKQALLR
jgi:hypothetical protein